MEALLLLAAIGTATAVGVSARRAPTAAAVVSTAQSAPTVVYVDRSRGTFLSLRRPVMVPGSAPLGQDARDLMFEAFAEHPGHGVTVATVIAIFREAESGNPQRQCDLFDDLEQPDCHLASLFEKRNEAVSAKDHVIRAANKNNDSELGADVLRRTFAALKMIETFQHLLSFNKYGYSAVEIDWGVRMIDGREWIVPTWLTPVPARRFRIGTGHNGEAVDELRLYNDPKQPRGEPLRAHKWIVVRRDASVRLACSGLMRSCAWPAIGKRYAFRDWLIYSDKYGKPLPLASYDEGADDNSKEVAAEIIQSIGSDVGAIKPKSIDVDFKEAKNTDNSKTHGGLIEHCNAEMSKRVNGSTLANDNKGSGGASYALGAVHDSVRWEAVQYDAGRIQEAFETQVFVPFCVFNDLRDAEIEMFIQVAQNLDPLTLVDIADKYKNKLGGEVSRGQLGSQLGFREPTDDDDTLPGMAETTATSDPAPTKEAA